MDASHPDASACLRGKLASQSTPRPSFRLAAGASGDRRTACSGLYISTDYHYKGTLGSLTSFASRSRCLCALSNQAALDLPRIC